MQRREDFEVMLAGTVPDERLEQIIEVAQRKFPAIFTGSTGERGVLFNALAYAFFSTDGNLSVLANSLDHHSLLRLTALAGGQRLEIPTFESLVQSFGVIVGVMAVRRQNSGLYRAFRLVRSLLKDLNVPMVSYNHFREAVEKVSPLVLNAMVKGETESKSIFTQLRDSVAKLDEAADTCLLKAAQTDDPAMLLRIHEKITQTTQSLTSFVDSLFSEYIEEKK